MNLLKLISLILLSTSLIFINNLYFLILSLLIILLITFFKTNFSAIKNRLVPLLFTVTLLIIFQLVFNSNQTSSLRFHQGLTAAIKILSLSLLVFLYTATTSINQISRAFNFLPKTFNFMLTITLSLIPVIFQEAKTIMLLQKSRGYHSPNPLPIIIPLLHRTLRRSEQIALTMSSRGY
ncbi:MAG: energy-coupling factor transporter transmembrane component T [Patescibacteria group bacterium]|nr:energy-coupling factor transporter transmembrane component T [Patescibacteria group bacterium]